MRPKRYRKDGWPICPVCDEDELAQLRVFDWPQDDEQRLAQMLASELFCYVCAKVTVQKGEAT